MSITRRITSLLLVAFFVAQSFDSYSQQNFYDNDLLPSSFHKERRELLREKLPPSSMVVVFSNPVRNRSNDVDFRFSQDPDLYYLTGLTEPDAALVIFSEPKDVFGSSAAELLFVREKDDAREIWDGKRLGVELASEILDIDVVLVNRMFLELKNEVRGIRNFYVKYPSDIDINIGKKSSLNRMVREMRSWLAEERLPDGTAQLLSYLAEMREVKSDEEIVLLQKAVDITCKGLEAAIKRIRPGMTEYQVQAVAEFEFRMMGSEYQGYGSICGSGPNTSILHYTDNRRIMKDGELVLMDIGAEYHGYTADITRTVPVNGKFTKEQRIIYDLVLEAQLEGIKKIREGERFRAAHEACVQVIGEGLRDLGIISSKGEYARYFMHGTSHYLGLEVHDTGTNGTLEPGNVLTVEPGIYIPEGSPCDQRWWGIGIRIEDDVLVTPGEPRVMSDKLPKDPDTLEKLMDK
jgi:Xaa-Pro aminopeptidase